MLDIKAALAYLCIVQLVATGVYLVMSSGMDTPFKNAVTQYPHLVAIKKGSAAKRRNLYLLGLAVGVGAVALWRPFEGPVWGSPCPACNSGGSSSRDSGSRDSSSREYRDSRDYRDSRR